MNIRCKTFSLRRARLARATHLAVRYRSGARSLHRGRHALGGFDSAGPEMDQEYPCCREAGADDSQVDFNGRPKACAVVVPRAIRRRCKGDEGLQS